MTGHTNHKRYPKAAPPKTTKAPLTLLKENETAKPKRAISIVFQSVIDYLPISQQIASKSLQKRKKAEKFP